MRPGPSSAMTRSRMFSRLRSIRMVKMITASVMASGFATGPTKSANASSGVPGLSFTGVGGRDQQRDDRRASWAGAARDVRGHRAPLGQLEEQQRARGDFVDVAEVEAVAVGQVGHVGVGQQLPA